MPIEKSPAFQFYPKDLLSDGKAMAMTYECLGMYWVLLCHDWIDDGIPDDDDEILNLLKYDSNQNHIVKKLRRHFIPHPTKKDVITNPRLIKERTKQKDWKEKCSKGGKNSPTQFKKVKAGLKDGVSDGLKDGPPMGTSSSSSSSSSTSSSVKDLKPLSGKPDFRWQQPLEYLNKKAGKHFRYFDKNKGFITARMNDGFTLEDFKRVVDNMVILWAKSERMERYLRPATLFSNKMDGYNNLDPYTKDKTQMEKFMEVGQDWLKTRKEFGDDTAGFLGGSGDTKSLGSKDAGEHDAGSVVSRSEKFRKGGF